MKLVEFGPSASVEVVAVVLMTGRILLWGVTASRSVKVLLETEEECIHILS